MRLILAAICLLAGIGQVPEPQRDLSREEVRATVAQVEAIVRREYFDAGLATRAGDRLRARHADGVYAAAGTADALARVLTQDLFLVTQDQHLVVSLVPERTTGEGQPAGSVESRETRARRANGGVQRVEILEGNIGYVNLTAFWRPTEAAVPIAAAMRLLQDADALIVDMRRNTGGSPETAALLSAYLIDAERTELFQIQPRTGAAVRYLADGVPAADRNGSRPVYVLTSRETFSAGEGFAYLLQERGRATIVGEPTAGAANPGRPYPVNARFEVTVPNGRVVSSVKQGNWEGTGVLPDVRVDAQEALATAHAAALRRIGPR